MISTCEVYESGYNAPNEGATLSVAEGFARETDEVASVEPCTSVADLLEAEANARLPSWVHIGARFVRTPTAMRDGVVFFTKACMVV
jgi:hypothetical protein